MAEKLEAEAIVSALAGRELTVGLIECGTGGAVSRRLFDTEDGPAVLGDSLNVDTVEEAIDLMGLPWQQFGKAGDFSAKAARAAARAGLELLEVDWCLAVWALPLPAEETAVQETVYLALNSGQEIVEQTVIYDGPTGGMHDWLQEQAVELINRILSKNP
jgi:nicotinamide mononucleotide (NMN) deamidase PncC